MRWLSRLVTVAVILTVVGLAALFLRSKVPKTTTGGAFVTWAKFRDGSRFAAGSPVVIAGVRVGDIAHLSIEGRFARVDLRLQSGLEIPVDSFVTRRSDSLFGDSYVEIILGGGDEGAANVRYLKSGEPLTHVIEGGSTDTVLRAIGRALPKVDNALEVAHDFMADGRTWVNGPMIERLTGVDSWLASGTIEGPITRADDAMISLENATTRGATAVAEAVPDVANRLARFDTAITSARKNIKDVRTGLVDGLHDAREGMDRIDKPVADFAEVMTAINEGHGDDWKGTLGRLVNEPDLANTLDDVTEGGRDAASSLNTFNSWLGARVEFNLHGRPRVYATAELHSRNDKFYLIEFEKSGLAGFPDDSLTENPNAAPYTRRQVLHDELRFTFQFGKQFGPFSFRGGVKDSTIGFGADFKMFEGRLQFSADLFGSYQRVPRLKLATAFAVFRSLYILAGVDDVLNAPGDLQIINGNSPSADVPEFLRRLHYGRDYFLGATLHFSDTDLATLLRVYGGMITAALL